MKARNSIGHGTINTYYYMNKDEKIPWHDHRAQGFGHGHFVVAGRTLVEQKGLPDQIRTDSQDNLELPFDVPHQITALEDNTVISHLGPLNQGKPPSKPGDYDYVKPAGRVNRVMMDDGTIVEIPID